MTQRLALILLVVAGLASCGLFVSFDEFDTSTTTGGARFAVGGFVDGLGSSPNARVSLTLNNGTPFPVGDGRFDFPERLADGAKFIVAIDSSPGFTCALTTPTTTVSGRDVDDVVVHCVSADLTLTRLSVSAGALSPPFAPAVARYSAGPVRVPARHAASTWSRSRGSRRVIS
ncbi:hypothetical protein BH11MYX4_BH11MYX4_34880 [soil metagenome]